MIRIVKGKPIFSHYIQGGSAISGHDFEEKVIFECKLFVISKCFIGVNPFTKIDLVYNKKTKKNDLPFEYWYYSKYLKFYKIYT